MGAIVVRMDSDSRRSGGGKTPAEWLDLLVAKAEALRQAGVVSVELEGCKVAFGPLPIPVG
jgi:hypothetical protein